MRNRCGESGVYYNLGLNAQMQQQDATALESFLKALELDDACPAAAQKRAQRLYAIGSVYGNMSKWEQALPYFQQAMSLDSARRDTAQLAKQLVALGNAYAGLGQNDRAMQAFTRASERSMANGDSLTAAYVEYNLASMMLLAHDLTGALPHMERSYAILLNMQRWAEVSHAALGLGDVYTQAGRYAEAERVLYEANQLADSLGLHEDLIYSMLGLTNNYEAMGKAKEALAWHRRYVRTKDSLQVNQRNEKLDEMTLRFETEKKEKELIAAREQELISKQETARQRSQKVVWLIGALFLGVLAMVLWNRVRTKRRHVAELEQRNAEVMRQKERAEESERAKDRFLANMSHELRTPLNAITGFTDLLLHDAVDERHRRFLTTIRNAGDNLMGMINDVLDLGRIEEGRYTLRNEPFDLHRCVRLCMDMLYSRAMDQGDELSLKIHDDVPQGVLGDSARLTQIILNLVGNALKFTSNGRVDLAVACDKEGVRFTVRDTGIGIPNDRLSSIFDRFSQVHDGDQRQFGGTGLGLAIVKELVALHKGAIEVQSQVKKGTVVTVSIPYQAARVDMSETPAVRDKPTGSLVGRSVLIAEDNEANALVAQEILARFHPGAHTVFARNGREALDVLRKDADNRVALVLMDVQMPELDGIAATVEVRALPGPVSRVPIIALTASVLPSDLGRCIDAGMDACLSKPFRTEELLVTIERLVGDPGAAIPVAGTTSLSAYDRLFKQEVPMDLSALRTALDRNDHGELARLVHRMRPQLVHRDKGRFAPLCDEVLAAMKRKDHGEAYKAARALITAIKLELERT